MDFNLSKLRSKIVRPEWVYIYRDIESKRIDYIGRSSNTHTFVNRIRAHKKDKWFVDNKYELLVCPARCRAESEAFETELINVYNPKYNIDKKGWGSIGIEMIDIDKFIVIKHVEIVLQDPMRITKVLDSQVDKNGKIMPQSLMQLLKRLDNYPGAGVNEKWKFEKDLTKCTDNEKKEMERIGVTIKTFTDAGLNRGQVAHILFGYEFADMFV